jgi:hypothetical protein
MGERSVLDKDGNVRFRLQRYSWRSPIVMGPRSGYMVRSVVGTDENGKFRAAIRVTSKDEAGLHEGTIFQGESFETQRQAMDAARERVQEHLIGESRMIAEEYSSKFGGDRMVMVDMEVGNPSPNYRQASIVGLEIEIPAARAKRILESYDKPSSRQDNDAPARIRQREGPSR